MFIKAISGNPYEALFALAMTTGMRPSEYLALTWNDLDFLNLGCIRQHRSAVLLPRSFALHHFPKRCLLLRARIDVGEAPLLSQESQDTHGQSDSVPLRKV